MPFLPKCLYSACQGLLDLEGDLTPILVSLVRKDKAVNDILDDTHDAVEDVSKSLSIEALHRSSLAP